MTFSIRTLVAGAAVALAAGCASTTPAAPVQFAGAPCVRPPPLHCPDKDCTGEMVTNQGSVIEPSTGRTYFLDYPCDLKPGEDVTIILSLHGGGSYGNWQRHYFPIVDQVDKQRLVIATPNTRGWSQADDPYLHAIVDNIVDTVGKENVKSFWLAGHSMGGYNSRRIVCDSYFRDKADGLLTLSGGRLGNPPDMPASAAGFSIPPTNGSSPAARAGGPPGAGPGGARPPSAGGPPGSGGPPGTGGPPGGGGAGPFGLINAAASAPSDCDFSYISTSGEHEPSSQALVATSSWADKYGCRPRKLVETVADTKAGYIYDSSRQEFGTDAWGRLPRPGMAQIMEYTGCRDGRIVADIRRMGKGHTEGFEPKVTEKIVQMMKQAKGGKIRNSAG